jgi:2-C-methyl-D-erythritol 4-phosphate cytidylyltransferase
LTPVPRACGIIVAGGSGRRFGGPKPKQFLLLGGKPLLYWSVRAFDRAAVVRSVVLVVPADFVPWTRRFVRTHGFKKVVAVVPGGAERADSVKNGINAAPADADVLLIHDAARPFVTTMIVSAVAAATLSTGAALAAWPLPDTLKRQSADGKPLVARTVSRAGLWLAQTPQGLRRDVAQALSRRAWPSDVTDDAQLAERAGRPVALVAASPMNFKVTRPEDFEMAKSLVVRIKR